MKKAKYFGAVALRVVVMTAPVAVTLLGYYIAKADVLVWWLNKKLPDPQKWR